MDVISKIQNTIFDENYMWENDFYMTINPNETST